jgi:hypothetical protein
MKSNANFGHGQGYVTTLQGVYTMSTPNTIVSVLLRPYWYFEQMVVMRYTSRVGFVGYTPKDVKRMAST